MTTAWKDSKIWVCMSHVPAAKMSYLAEICWFDCGAIRPTDPRPAPEKKKAPKESLGLRFSRESKFSPKPQIVCAMCGIKVKRKPSEIAANKTGKFYCSVEHSRGTKAKVEVAAEVVVKAKAKVAVKAKAKVAAKVVQLFKVCAWKDCDTLPSKNSKYCSRNCCVKNAHWNERQRRKEQDVCERTA